MKILIISQRYWPENFRITDIAENLVKLGHDVTVLTGLPNYPKGYVYPEYKKRKNRIQNHNGVNIIRVREIARRHNIIFRFLNYYSFLLNANARVKRLKNDYDVVFINELSPITSSIPGIKYAKKHNKNILMYEMDLWPESLLAGGIKKDSFLYNHYKKVSSKIYSKCNKILVSTKEHIEYIHNLPHCGHIQIECLPQYAENFFETKSIKKTKTDTFNVMFAGNIGKAQCVDTIVKSASILKNNSKIQFHILGDGLELKRCEELAQELNLNNIAFYGNKPINEMPYFYNLADVMLVTLDNSPYSLFTIPGKVQTYMASGKPIIGCIEGATANLILEAECGECCKSKDFKSLANLILKFSNKNLNFYSSNSFNYYLKHYNSKMFFAKLNKELIALSLKE